MHMAKVVEPYADDPQLLAQSLETVSLMVRQPRFQSTRHAREHEAIGQPPLSRRRRPLVDHGAMALENLGRRPIEGNAPRLMGLCVLLDPAATLELHQPPRHDKGARSQVDISPSQCAE